MVCFLTTCHHVHEPYGNESVRVRSRAWRVRVPKFMAEFQDVFLGDTRLSPADTAAFGFDDCILASNSAFHSKTTW